MERKVILVTGGNRGIGYEIVRQLSELSHKVFLGARDRVKAEEALARLYRENLEASYLSIDVSDQESITQAVAIVRSITSRVDVIINNAAVLMPDDRLISAGTAEVFHKTMRTNVFGPLQVVRSFLPLIPSGGRIIMTSSGGGSMTDPVGGWSPVYCISKSALNAVTRQLAYELTPKGISVNAYCPGWVKTAMGGKSAPRAVEQGADTAVWLSNADQVPTGKFFRDRKEIAW